MYRLRSQLIHVAAFQGDFLMGCVNETKSLLVVAFTICEAIIGQMVVLVLIFQIRGS